MKRSTVVVNEAVGEIRREPSHAAEQVSQAVLATPLAVLGERDHGRWLRVECPDGYRGWIRTWSVVSLSSRDVSAYRSGPAVEVDALVARIHEGPSSVSAGIREAPLGVRLKRLGKSGRWIRVLLPDGQKGYLHAGKLLVDRQSLRARTRSRDIPSVARTARRFLGCPYQWGGVTAKGIDCSGLIQTAFRLHGVILPRDSRDQFRWAKRESFIYRDPGAIQFGHLLFFGEGDARISHVAMSLGNNEFIHARGRVRLNSLHPDQPLFDRDLYRIFRGASPVLIA
jgi:cell wall-associated NlpC family hydrolase